MKRIILSVYRNNTELMDFYPEMFFCNLTEEEIRVILSHVEHIKKSQGEHVIKCPSPPGIWSNPESSEDEIKTLTAEKLDDEITDGKFEVEDTWLEIGPSTFKWFCVVNGYGDTCETEEVPIEFLTNDEPLYIDLN